MNSFQIRLISAIIAVAILGACLYFLGIIGLHILVGFAVIAGGIELTRLLMATNGERKVSSPRSHQILFYSALLLTYFLSSYFFSFAILIFPITCILLLLVSLLWQKDFLDLNHLLFFQARCMLGILYMGLIPVFVIQIIDLPQGIYWFLTLLGIVFSGDVGAYLVGVTLGKNKIMPRLSPQKTWEGAVGGIVFSMLAGFICSMMLPAVPKSGLIALSLIAGILAQFGDFFESLLKRGAEVKDSGKLMPGHGGILDRIDGILFASPIIFFGATLFDKYFS